MIRVFRLYLRVERVGDEADPFADVAEAVPAVVRALREAAAAIETAGSVPWAYRSIHNEAGEAIGGYALKGERE